MLGAGVYMIVEVIPDLGLLHGAFQGFGRRSRIRDLEIQILDNPSAGNLEELAELNFEQGNYRKAREALNRSIALRADSPHAFYLRASAGTAKWRCGRASPSTSVGKFCGYSYPRAPDSLAIG